jgi:hypothetical protein
MWSCLNSRYEYNAFINGVCGSAFNYQGQASVIAHNVFQSNGQWSTTGNDTYRSDGLVMASCDSSIINNNYFVDNTRNAFVIGGGANTWVKDNWVTMQGTQAIAGLVFEIYYFTAS